MAPPPHVPSQTKTHTHSSKEALWKNHFRNWVSLLLIENTYHCVLARAPISVQRLFQQSERSREQNSQTFAACRTRQNCSALFFSFVSSVTKPCILCVPLHTSLDWCLLTCGSKTLRLALFVLGVAKALGSCSVFTVFLRPFGGCVCFELDPQVVTAALTWRGHRATRTHIQREQTTATAEHSLGPLCYFPGSFCGRTRNARREAVSLFLQRSLDSLGW